MKLLNRTLSFALSLVLALSLAAPAAVRADGPETITDAAITYDTAMAFPTTRLTGRQVSEALLYALTCSSSAEKSDIWYVYSTVNSGRTTNSYTCLVYMDEGRYRTLEASDDALDPEREYYFQFNVEDNGGVFDPENLPAVTVNGYPADDVRWTTQRADGDIYAYQRVYLNDTADCAWRVTIDPAEAVVQKGTTRQFTAVAEGTDTAVLWSLTGANKPGTTVSNTGLLSVAADETAEEITVRARSVVNNVVYAEAAVTVISEAVGIDSVSVSPTSASLYRGNSTKFTVVVVGTDLHDVEWELIGSAPLAGAAGDVSTVSPSGASAANVSVSSKETAETLTLRVVSVQDNSKYAEATIHVLDRPRIETVAITYDANAVVLGSDRTGAQISTELTNAITCSKSNGPLGNENYGSWRVYLNYSNGAYEPSSYTCLVKKVDGRYTALHNSAETLDPLGEYYLRINVEDNDGYEFDPDQIPAVTINGTPADDVQWTHQDYNGDIYAYQRVVLRDVFQCVAQPESVTAEIGDEVAFTVNFAGALTYQWQESADGVNWTASAATGSTTDTLQLTVSVATAGKQYRCYITGVDAQTFTTDTVQISIPFEITAQPEDQIVTLGGPFSFHVDAVGAASYQWQISKDGESWSSSSLPGNDTDTLSSTATEKRAGNLYRCHITSLLGQTLDTDVVHLYLIPSVDGALNAAGGELHFENDASYPWIADVEDGLPYAYSGNAGEPATDSEITLSVDLDAKKLVTFAYKVTAEGDEAGNIYDYGAFFIDGEPMFRRCAAEAWTEFAALLPVGAHTLTWTFHKDSSNNFGMDCFAVRNVRITDPTLTVSVQPEDFTGGVGETFTFTTAAIGNAPVYQWQYSKDGGETWADSSLSGNATATLSDEITALRLERLYRCKITDAGSTVYTNAVRIIEPELTLVGLTGSLNLGIGEPFELMAAFNGSGVTYQWQQYNTETGLWENCTLAGNQTESISGTMTVELVDTRFRCVATDRLGATVPSSEMYLWEKSLSLSREPAPVCANPDAQFVISVEADGSQLAYQWQQSADGENWTNSALSGSNTAALTGIMTEQLAGVRFRCVLTDRVGRTSETETVVLSTPALRDDLANASGSSLSFASAGGYPWVVREKDGALVAASGNRGVNSTESVLTLDVDLAEATTLRFEYLATGEGDEQGSMFDYGAFSVDGGEPLFKRCAAAEWTEFETEIPAGAHTLTWKFHKDSSNHSFDDCMYLRGVRLGDAPALEITAQPVDYTGPVGDTASFTVTATGNDLTYTWEYKDVGGVWKTSSATTATATCQIKETRDGRQYRCTVSDGVNSEVSAIATLHVGAALAITAQPEDYTGPVGDTASFTVTATGNDLTYTWEYKDVGGVWKTSSATTATATCQIKETRDGRQYRCTVSDGVNSEVSAIATLHVGAALAITAQPVDFTGAIGDTATFTVAATGNDLTYTWEYKDVGGVWKTSSATTATATCQIRETRDGRQYRCTVSDGVNSEVSAIATLHVGAALAITAQPVDYTGPVGDTASFTVTATGNDLTYTWEYKDVGGVWKTSSATTATATCQIRETRDGRQYRCTVSDGVNSEVSAIATLHVGGAGVTITAQPQDFAGAIGETATFTVAAAGDGLTYQWQYLKVATGEWKNYSAYKTNTMALEITEARAASAYRCVVTDSHGGSATSAEVRMIVGAALAITAQPVDYTGPVGDTASFTVTATGNDLTYTWEYKDVGGVWKTSSATTATATCQIKEARDGRQYRCTVSDGVNSEVSAIATLHVG